MTTTPRIGDAVICAEGDELVIRIPVPEVGAGVGAQVLFAARGDHLDSPLAWVRMRAAHRALTERTAESDRPAVDSRELFDPFTTVAAEYAVAAHVSQTGAERFLAGASDCFTRIPRIGECLRDGLITVRAFDALRHETALIEDSDVLDDVDSSVAAWIRGRGRGSVNRVAEAARRFVSRHDPDAARRRQDARQMFKDAGSTALDGRLSKFTVVADAEDVRLSQEVVDAVAAGVCADDPRTAGERRADAAVALLQRRRFVCACPNPECPAANSDAEVAARCARIVLHVVVREETLDGSDDTPAYLDGDGPIAADHVVQMRRRPDVSEQNLHLGDLLDRTARPGDGHSPTSVCAAVVRGLFGRCSWPGCTRAAYRCDLDHVWEYNHRDPALGGPTCWCNLNPKCRFHHLLKTTLDEWVDDQVVDADGRVWTEVTSPTGVSSRIEAANSWLLPEVGLLPCRHGPPAVPGIREATDPQRRLSRTEAKHRYRMRRRAQNRRARARERERQRREASDVGDPDY